jgi:ABC-type polysaccharide/polyol phosphate export permease
MIASQLLFFVTPVFYTIEPGTMLHTVNLFNPVFYFVNISRSLLIDRTFPPLWMFGVILGMGALACFVGIKIFEAKKRELAEKV